MCLGFEPKDTGWKAQTNRMGFDRLPQITIILIFIKSAMYAALSPPYPSFHLIHDIDSLHFPNTLMASSGRILNVTEGLDFHNNR